MGAGLRALPAGYRGTRCRLVFGSGAHLTAIRPMRSSGNTYLSSIPAKILSSVKSAGGVQAGRGRRSYGNRRLAGSERTGRDSGPMPLRMALKDENGELQGFARVVRDFSDRHERDEKLRRSRARIRPIPLQSTIAGIVSGEFDRVPEVNDAFLELVGYSREDLLAGRLHWPDLTPPEYAPLDELAHEEGLRFGACTPFEKELIRKDGTRVPVLVATAVLKLSPFRWITFVQDLRERDRAESVEDEDVEAQTGLRGDCGQQRGSAAGSAAGGSGGADRCDRVDPGGNRHRQGTGRARHPSDESAQDTFLSSH